MLISSKKKILHWTYHAREKMKFYRLSESRVKRILHSPARVEEGIAPKTIAMMQVSGSKKHPHEIWVMIEDKKKVRKIISAWRYPGRTKPRSEITVNIIRSAYEDYLKES